METQVASPVTVQGLANHGIIVGLKPDAFHFHRTWKETMMRLDSLERRVRDGRDLDTALFFAQYVVWTDLDKLTEWGTSGTNFAVEPGLLLKTAEKLQGAVREKFTLGQGNPKTPDGQLEAIHRKLETLAGGLSALYSEMQELRRRNASEPKENPQLCVVSNQPAA